MDKLKFFTFNNLRWQYRKFRWDDIKDSCGALCLAGTGYVWLEPFASHPLEFTDACKANLCRMLGLTAADVWDNSDPEWWKQVDIGLTNDHFVDAEGVAWPGDTLAVVPNSHCDDPVCFLVTPRPRFS